MPSTLVEKHFDEIKVLFAEGLNAIDEAMDAERVVLGREGDPLYLGPDYAIRTAATRLFNELCLRCRKPPVEEREKAPLWTMEYATKVLIERNPEIYGPGGAWANDPRQHGKSKSP